MFNMIKSQLVGMDSSMGMESLTQFYSLLKLIVFFLIAAVVIIIVYVIYASLSKKKGEEEVGGGQRDEEILEILRRRYARGEITREEFQERKEELLSEQK